MINYKLPFLKKKNAVKAGLDIGNYNLKAAEIESKEGAFKLINVGMRSIRQPTNIAQAIRELYKEINISTKEVNISVSGENVVARYLSLPKMSEAELKKAMVYELEEHIPFKADEVYTDYTILGDDPNSKNRMRVFLVATKKELLENRIKLVQEAGLSPQVVTMDALAIKNAFYFNYPSKTSANVALLNIGNKITNLIITKDKIPYFVRDSQFGGDTITALIQAKLDLDKAKAEELKYHLHDAPLDLSETIKSAMANLLNEIFVSLDFYENLTEQRIDEVYISGGSYQLPGLKEFLGGYLGLEITDLNPLKNISLSPNLTQEKLTPLLPYLAVAIGLALEEV